MSWFQRLTTPPPVPSTPAPAPSPSTPAPAPPGVQKDILLLGPGTSKHRIPPGSAPLGSQPNERLTVIDTDPEARKAWPEARVLNVDLRAACSTQAARGTIGLAQIPQLAEGKFSEVHAYELLNLLPGDEIAFFAFWREMWRVLKPGGSVWATVPHWRSPYVYAYPAPQRVYTLELLAYLDPQASMTAKSDFSRTLWPTPYRFRLDNAWEITAPRGAVPIGLHFHLVKEVA